MAVRNHAEKSALLSANGRRGDVFPAGLQSVFERGAEQEYLQSAAGAIEPLGQNQTQSK